ncbi:MAG: FHA domain-containing protein [Acidimicrobiia bacterium]
MSVSCPQGHPSETDDFCDVCGEPIAAGAVGLAPAATGSPAPPPASSLTLDPPAAAAPPAPAQECANCGEQNPADALFCESCGYDFTTGQAPEPAPPMPDPGAAWVAEVWIDPDWFAVQNSPGGCATSGAPTIVPVRTTTAAVGRRSQSRGITPEVDCSGDGAVSHQHAQLVLDHDRWYVEDLGSTNGTFVGSPGNTLPTTPLEPHQRHELADDERVYIGAWTRIQIRPALPRELTN